MNYILFLVFVFCVGCKEHKHPAETSIHKKDGESEIYIPGTETEVDGDEEDDEDKARR